MPPRSGWTRRGVGQALGLGLAAGLVSCGDRSEETRVGGAEPLEGPEGFDDGRLAFRPGTTEVTSVRTATSRVEGSRGPPSALLHVPSAASSGPTRLLVMLHGAGGSPAGTIGLLRSLSERHGFALLVPKSRQSTWDMIRGGFGPDVENIDALLRRTSEGVAVSGITVAGFSDGASYALSLGISNGDVFDTVVAFSPGFAAPRVRHGRPRFFVSHGTGDRVLPIDRCSRRIVPRLRGDGYDVTYEEFEGGHEVSRAIREQAVAGLEQGW